MEKGETFLKMENYIDVRNVTALVYLRLEKLTESDAHKHGEIIS
jgi:hypothetical protein